ncbi:uncharacterized protein LOC131431907 [Malaya genurostris]|uniref:uncharacterized protein LOC131431907 n=1 Tax=Malaya genurostris TaxID=325434 RepID=UPI0026F3C6BA|nr:uncharacterized protein LOC131431907 [Malaya genurostris]
MKLILASLLVAASAVSGVYHPYYHGYNPHVALQALGLYSHHFLAPVAAPVAAVPFSGTYAYHDGHRPTVVQTNSGTGIHSVPHTINNLYAWNPWSTWQPTAVHYAPPAPVVKPLKTIVQANLGGGDPWNYGAFYGTGIYGFGYNNYIPVRLAK